ncbi:hypothetical protein POM88_000547 [Heracleum sosnowskyi]|uniref:Uncharacterized protein n=1 Tax=Heracleum sosnowskyi TaxID=360622 RepID=A0AAD8JAY2_9APIA|nr:hypothetical protein POM88_000547 [Heracleum sosnowskyi]
MLKFTSRLRTEVGKVDKAKIRSLSVVPRKSFISSSHPDGMEEERFDFLHVGMTISLSLRVEAEAYYIIDTLRERLYEECNQAYIPKSDQQNQIPQVTSSK